MASRADIRGYRLVNNRSSIDAPETNDEAQKDPDPGGQQSLSGVVRSVVSEKPYIETLPSDLV
jgi:hypothetical protein